MSKYLVVGGNGFLGRHLVRALVALRGSVRVADLNAASWFDPASVETRVIDMFQASASDFDAVLEGMDCVYHCAWSTIPESANRDPMGDMRVNLGMTLGLLDALKRKKDGGKIVFCSSGGTVYGPLLKTPVPEEHPLDPITAYGVSKLAAEKYLQLYRKLHGIDARVARIANPYGAGQSPQKPQGVIGMVVHRALTQTPIEIWGTGEVVRDFIHVADVVSALLALADAPSSPQESMPLFNFGSGVGCSVNAILAQVEECLGAPLDVRRLPSRAFDVPCSVLDISKARLGIGWQPKVSLQAGIAQMISDLKQDRTRAFSSW